MNPNFKKEWVTAISRNSFVLTNEQNIRTWQREWPTLDEDSKKAAMANLIRLIGNKKIDDNATGLAPRMLDFLAPYISVFTNKDALAWTTAFMSSDLPKRSAQDYETPTFTFAAHLLDWVRESHPSVLKKCVAMLEPWEPLTRSKFYKGDDKFPGALERLAAVMPNTALERTCALACAISGQDALLASLLSRPKTDTTALLKHAQSIAQDGALFSMLAALDTTNKDAIFTANAHDFGKKMLSVYKKQTQLEEQANPRVRIQGEDQHVRCKFLHKLVALGVECGNESVALLKMHASQMAIPRFFYYLGELSVPWSQEQHDSFMEKWNYDGGFYVSEDMFANPEHRKFLLNALAKLPAAWTEWFEFEYRDELKQAASGLLDPKGREAISIEGHRWFFENMPSLYKHWIRGLPANPLLLNDPVVGETAWEYTQAGNETFVYHATMAWIKAPELNYDLQHAAYPLAKLAWARRGVDLDASLQEAVLDTQCEYRALAFEAISPGMGKNRWLALTGIVDVYKESKEGDHEWSQHPLVQDVLNTCIEERLNPSKTPDLRIDNAPSLFA